jgi:hypothetical protein
MNPEWHRIDDDCAFKWTLGPAMGTSLKVTSSEKGQSVDDAYLATFTGKLMLRSP